MTVKGRTDIHHPSVILPEDYTEVAIWTMNIQGLGDAEFIRREREIVREHMARTGGTYAHVETTGNCQICGNVQAIYLVLFYHAKSNTYVRVGMDCAAKLGMSGNEGKWNLFRKNVRDAREAQAGKRKALAILEDAGLGNAWDIFTTEVKFDSNACMLCSGVCRNQYHNVEPWEEHTIRDIVVKLVKYGSISEKQTAFIRSLLQKIQNRPIIAAQRAAEREAATPCPKGRVRITGTVVGTKVVEDRFNRYSGEKTNILVKSDSGFVVYGSRFNNVTKGDKVDFTATVTPSEKDMKFGFFKRPFSTLEGK